MNDKESKEFRSLTFSQREGHTEPPEALQVGELTKKFRIRVWHLLATSMTDCSTFDRDNEWRSYFNKCKTGEYWSAFLDEYSMDISHIPHDENEIKCPVEAKKWMKDLIIYNEDGYHIIDMLEYMLRLRGIPKKLSDGIEACFSNLSPYLVIRSGELVCVIPTTSKEMKNITKSSLDNINKSSLVKARIFLHKAAEQLNNKDFPASVRESIQAVESAALQIYSKSSGKFDDAVHYLAKEGFLKHPTWKEILTKLNGYAGDRKDVRHPPPKPKDADVDFNEAICVYGVCVSIVDYLARQSDLLKDQ